MITAAIVLYKTPDHLLRRLLQCVEDSYIERVFVYDNSSMENSRVLTAEFSKAEYEAHPNTGYGSTHNEGIRKAIEVGSDYHVVLNPDIVFEPGSMARLAAFCDSEENVGQVMPKVIYPNGEMQYLCKLLPTPFDLILRRFLPKWKVFEKRNDRYILKDSGYDKVMNPPCLSGCFMFLNVRVLKKYDLWFDDRYFMYCEDFDLVRRIHRVSRTLYYPEVTVIHDHEKASYKSRAMLRVHILSAVKYFNKFGWIFDSERRRMNRQIVRELR